MKMTLQILLVIIAAIILVYLAFVFAKTVFSPATAQNALNSVCINGKCFFVELAKSQAEKEKGLMHRASLEKDKGVFFIFDKEAVYPFWMKNTLIPLDIIWVNANNEIVFIAKDALPCKSLICQQINPRLPAKYVLEINAGLCGQHSFKEGDKVQLNLTH